MKKKDENQLDKRSSRSRPSAMDLRGRQSVRATFRLSEACIDAISILAAQLGIKQKSVFDHLMEDAQVLKELARELTKTKLDRPGSRIQKTFVISRRSLSFLESISDEFNAPRDALVEYSVRRLLPIIAKERKRHEKRKKLQAEISNHFAEGENLLLKTKELLGVDDPIVIKLATTISFYKSTLDDITNFIDRGKIIEEFQVD
ncbi:MAG: hypothetical protein PVG35_08710 [Desulfobacterales bacterium]|jgi:hypothetical protein